MIHQCYFEDSQRAQLFASPLYRGFGLYPHVNPDLARNCPELAGPEHATQLNEFAAMLHLWRNPELDPDPWIGFTSYRQMEKFPTIWWERQEVELELSDADIVGWGMYTFLDLHTGRPVTLAEQAERTHPGITSVMWRLMMLHNESLPQNYLSGNIGLFCNYWVMLKKDFQDYMAWATPLVFHALKYPDPFVENVPRSLSYIAERLFICWYGLRKKEIKFLGGIQEVRCANPMFGPIRPFVPQWPVSGAV